MDIDILDSLEDLSYTGSTSDEDGLMKATKEGPTSTLFTQLVEWLVQRIADLCGLDERVHAITDSSDSSSFLLEVSGFLREYGCPYPDLTEGPVDDRLNTPKKCLQLLDFLTSELQAVKIIGKNKPAMLPCGTTEQIAVTEPESEVASCMKKMFLGLGFPKPPQDITAKKLFDILETKVKELMTKYPGQTGKPLLKANLSEEQWKTVGEINETLLHDYRMRKEMLLKRLDVTIQSFTTSEKAKLSQDRIAREYRPIRRSLKLHSHIGVPYILAARDDLTLIKKTSTGDSRKECAINKVMIGKVPDRGGRAWELEPPPAEMPFFMKRDNSAPRGGRGRGGRGGGGRGWHQGGGQGHHKGRGGRKGW